MVELHHRTEEDKVAEVRETHRSSEVNTKDLLKYHTGRWKHWPEG